ncbi:hypothetical protein GF327_04485 [Candidatus Woesearchaeota archaeon]|nr:hypothetical protein [Candidatus Woesearchaeota archaeon]
MKFRLILLLLIMPCVFADSVIFTEIMSDPPGNEGQGKEWIEIKNIGETDVNLEGYRFYEDDTNHFITLIQGDLILSPGDFAVIAEEDSVFLMEYPDYNKTLFDSYFSLNYKGEYIALKDSEENIIDSVTYIERNDDGYSVELNCNDEWISETYQGTPGTGFTCISDMIPEFSTIGLTALLIIIGLYVKKKK